MTRSVQPKRIRRSTEEVVDRILTAAREEFEKHGYAGAKTASIARRAEVSEPLIFNHFGSKARLFQSTIFEPLNDHLQGFVARHPAAPSDEADLRENSRQFILEMQQFVERHSRMMASLLVAQLYDEQQVQGMAQVAGLEAFFSKATMMVEGRLGNECRGDIDLMGRFSFATILASVVFKDWLFPPGTASDATISEALCNFVFEGFNANANA